LRTYFNTELRRKKKKFKKDEGKSISSLAFCMQNIFTILFPHPPKNFKKCLLHMAAGVSPYMGFINPPG